MASAEHFAIVAPFYCELIEFSGVASRKRLIGPPNFSEIRVTMAAIIKMVTLANCFVPTRSVRLSRLMLWPGSEPWGGLFCRTISVS
jgi:hypothetical protein